LDAEKTVLPLQRMIDGQTPGNTVGTKIILFIFSIEAVLEAIPDLVSGLLLV